jgi:ankyrin repeat protein
MNRAASLAALVIVLGFSLAVAAQDPAADLLAAIKANQADTIKELCAANPALIRQELSFRDLPLFEAVKERKGAAVRALLEAGAPANSKAKNGWTAAQMALSSSFIGTSFEKQVMPIIEALRDHQADFNAPNPEGKSAFYLVATAKNQSKEDAEALTRLIDAVVAAGGNPNTGLRNKTRPALVHQVKAINTTNPKTGKPSAKGFGAHNALVITKLLEIGADPNEADENKTTPLIAAMTSATMTEEERLEVVKLLVGHGANPNAKNKKGETPKRLVAKGSPIEDVLKRPKNYLIKK